MDDRARSSQLHADDVVGHLDEAADGILLTDNAGRVTYANRAAALLLGVDEGTLVGRAFGVPLVTGESQEIEVRTPDGMPRVLVLKAKPVTVGEAERWVVTMRDESQRTAATRLLVEQLDARDTALATTSHELRSSLAAMSLAVETLRANWAELSEVRRTELMGLLDRHLLRMSTQIERFLDTVRAGTGVFSPAPKTTAVLDAALESLAGLGVDDGDVRLEVPVDCTAEIDPFHLMTILSNLIGNSLKYGGRPMVVRAHTLDHTTTIAVSDSGPGVDAESVAGIFERSARSDWESSHKGYGLGLWIARSLARVYGGDLTYEPNVPNGARFVCRLPAGNG